MSLKNKIRNLFPPVILKVYRKLFVSEANKQKVVKEKPGFFNSYVTWQDSKNECTGYEEASILAKVKESLLKIKNGEAVYERDSVIFKEKQYSEELLSALLDIAKKNNQTLNVLDFGGSLGSTYYQNKSRLSELKSLKWNIVEQAHFVKEGKETFADNELNFYYTIQECLAENEVNVVILSGVLQCIEHSSELITEIKGKKIPNIIVDRTALIRGDKGRISKQVVPEWIYKASYPIHFFNEIALVNQFTKEYNLVADFDSFCDADYTMADGAMCYWKGFYFALK